MRSAFVCLLLLVASLAMGLAAAKPCGLQQHLSQAAMQEATATADIADFAGHVVSAAPICVNPMDVAVTQEDRSEMIPVPPARTVVAASRTEPPACAPRGALADLHERLLRPPSPARA